MQENKFYDLPENSIIKEIKYVSNKGFIAYDKEGNELFTIFIYDNGPDYPSEGLIRIIDNNKIGFANLKGKIIILPQFDAALPFSDGLAAVCNGCLKMKIDEHYEMKGGNWGFINKTGGLVIPYKYDQIIESFSNGIAKVKLDGYTLSINKNNFEVKGDEMNYSEWIKIFEKVTRLIDKLFLNENYSVKNSYDENSTYLFADKNTRYLKTALYQGNKKLLEYDIIPWTDFTLNQNRNDFPNPTLTNEFVTVTEYAVVYKSYQTTDAPGDVLKEMDKFDEIIKAALNYNALNLLQEEELNYPEDVQVISTKVYNYFVELQIAIPGSKLPDKDEWRKVCKDRMLHLHLVPDMGEIKSSWIKTEPDAMNVYYTSVEDSLLVVFNSSIDQALSLPNKQAEIYDEGKERIRSLFNAANSYVNVLNDRYQTRLYNWLLLHNAAEVYPTTENIFGDYEPKRTPDTIEDYAPQLIEEFNKLPDAEITNLNRLLELFEQYKSEAENNPGQWEDGNMILGANPKEYRPSKEELILNEIGNRINSIADKNIKQQNTISRTIEYKNFTIIHYDVMGSGRFFYVDDIQKIKVQLK